jgi:hypothetical protein
MKIRAMVGLSGNEYSIAPGDEREFPKDEAIRLIEANFAVPVADVPIERAVKDAPTERRGKKGKSDVAETGSSGADD